MWHKEKIKPCLFFLLLTFSSPGITETQSEIILVNLNQSWTLTPKNGNPISINVPCFYVWNSCMGFMGESPDGLWKEQYGISEASYTKTFTINTQMSGKQIFLRFEAVNFVADFYLNDQFICSHLGGFVPFEINITPYVAIPSNNTLRVNIRYDNRLIVLDYGKEKPLWPIGYVGQYYFMGIVGDVTLIGRPSLNIEWGFVRTSVREKKISVDVSVQNVEEIDHDATVSVHVKHDGYPVLTVGSKQITIGSQDNTVVTIEKDWNDPTYWTPKNPNLYEAVISLNTLGTKIDEKTIRFGFREFWIENNHFVLNGIRQNLRGDNVILHGEKIKWKYFVPKPTENKWATILDSMLALNINVIRLHQEPAPPWMLDVCDEKGMMIIAESAIYGHAPFRSQQYTNNSTLWLKEWIKRDRNHPSIVIWSAANELTHGRQLSDEQIMNFGNAVTQMDPTRPFLYDGDKDIAGSPIYSYHYMLGGPNAVIYRNWPNYSIYEKLTPFVQSNKPTSWGEFCWYKPRTITQNDWVKLQCIETRAGRILEVSDIRPYRLDWSWHPSSAFFEIYDDWHPSDEQVQFLRNTMNPVAVFDKAYYEYQFDPSRQSYTEGTIVNREYVLFNDEIENTTVDIRFEGIVDGSVVTSSQFTENIPLGERIIKDLGFTVPYVPYTQDFILCISTWKNGIRKFSEDYLFRAIDIGISPPQSVTDLAIETSDQNLVFSWSPVTKNLNNKSTVIDHYNLYMSTQYDFENHLVDSIIGITTTSYVHVSSKYIGNPETNYFFGVKAIDTAGQYSNISNIVAEFDFQLITTEKTSYNTIALPLQLSGITDANDLLTLIPGCSSVGQWNGTTQSYDQYSPIIPPTLFTVQVGFPYYIYMTANRILTFSGKPVFPSFQLWNNDQSSSFHEIMLPLNYYHVKNASDLCEEIPYCNSAAYWDAENQGYVQFSTDIPAVNDFDVRVGYPYHIHVTEDGVWPTNGSKKINLVSKPHINYQMESLAPHLVWGKYQQIYEDTNPQKLGFQAWIEGREQEILTEKSSGCLFNKDIWIVQCGNFGSAWKTGDVLIVQFVNNHLLPVKTLRQKLSFNPADRAEDVIIDQDNGFPIDWFLSQNYPNPFNPITTFKVHIRESGQISINIYNMVGQKIKTLLHEWREPGSYTVNWDGMDEVDCRVPSGMYIVQLQTESVTIHRKILLIQ